MDLQYILSAEAVTARREAAGLGSVADLARTAGLDPSTVSRALRGEPCTLTTARRLAAALATDLTIIADRVQP